MRKIAFVVLVAGAICSLGFVLNAGRHSPIFLLILFVGWVLSPFIALFLVDNFSKLRLIIAPIMLYWVMLFVAFGSTATYCSTLIQHRTKTPTAVYLGVPFFSWLIIAIAIAMSAYRKRNQKVENL